MLAGHTGLVDDLLRKGVTNSQVIFERLLGQGYAGGLTTVKTYIAAHRDLVPAKRRQAAPQGCRGQRFRTAPGEAYQMDWGFVAVERPGGERARIACFAMVCHHCGGAHVEFFPNARQENLLIGMLHAFSALGVPATVLTDNMKSVVVRRDADGRPVWQADYAEFMGVVGFRTRLCRPRRPYTKGKVERLVRFVKGNFLAGRSFTDLDALNREAALWCAEQGGRWRRAAACVPMREHEAACSANTRPLEVTAEVERYLCPRRKISFDGFVSFEGHRYGVPYWYVRRECRVNREGRVVHIYSDDLSRELVGARPRARHHSALPKSNLSKPGFVLGGAICSTTVPTGWVGSSSGCAGDVSHCPSHQLSAPVPTAWATSSRERSSLYMCTTRPSRFTLHSRRTYQ